MPNLFRKFLILFCSIILFVLFLATTAILIGWTLTTNNYISILGHDSIFGVNLAWLYDEVGNYIADFEPWYVLFVTCVSGVFTIISLLQTKNAITDIK